MLRIGVKSLIVIAVVLTASVSPVYAQQLRGAGDSEVGRPIIRNFSPEEYGGGTQNWAIVQDHRGMLYVGSANGVLEYDGVAWRLILTPNQGTVRSLAVADTGRIYAGAVSEFGYLEPDTAGEMRFVSLMDHIPEGARQFGDVWRTHVLPDGVYFQTETALYRWADGAINVLKPTVRFNRSSAVGGRLYLPQPGIGMTILDGDSFRPLPGTERLADEPFSVVLPYDDRRVLFGTRIDGSMACSCTTALPWSPIPPRMTPSSRRPSCTVASRRRTGPSGWRPPLPDWLSSTAAGDCSRSSTGELG